MTQLLLKLFVKNHHRSDDAVVRASVGKLAGITGILCNILLFCAKLAVGLLSGSISATADAFNNLTDAASSVTTLLGFRMAQQPADEDHPYGHARYEYLAGLAVAMLILLIGSELGLNSLRKIFSPQQAHPTVFTYCVLLLSMALKFWLFLFNRALGQKIGSTALLASAADSRNDVLATAAVFIGCLCEQFVHLQVDGWVGLGVAAFILISGFGIAKDTISPLIGQQADAQLLQQISDLVLRHEKVLGIHDLLVHDYGPGKCFASVHVEISAEETPLDSHHIIDDIERDALAELNVHLVIHYDPVQQDDEQERMYHAVTQILADISPDLSLHDFRLLRYARQTRLYFDLEVPYSMGLTDQQLQQQIDAQLPDSYTAIISFDRKA